MNSAPPLHAWVDESMHTTGGALAEGIYLLAATIADPASCEPARDVLRGLRPGQAPRLRWRDSDQRSRRRISKAAAELDLLHTVVIGTPLDQHRQERARRLCMQRLLYELSELGVSHVWIENRTQSLNRRDMQMIDALRSTRAIPDSLTLDFAMPSVEPMLWVPDIVAGAVGLYRRDDDPIPYEALQARITEHEIRI